MSFSWLTRYFQVEYLKEKAEAKVNQLLLEIQSLKSGQQHSHLPPASSQINHTTSVSASQDLPPPPPTPVSKNDGATVSSLPLPPSFTTVSSTTLPSPARQTTSSSSLPARAIPANSYKNSSLPPSAYFSL